MVGASGCARALAGRLDGAEAEVLDCAQAQSLPPCDVAVLLGDPASPGDHEELLRRNLEWVRAAAAAAVRRSPGCVLVVAAKPVNALALAALRACGLARQRVLGVAGMTDALRLSGLIARLLGVGPEGVQALAMGGCAQTLVALPRLCAVAGIPVTELLSPEQLGGLVEAARAAATPEELIAAAAQLAGVVLSGRRRLLPCSVYLEGEYGVQGVFLAVPAVLGAGGLERVVQLNLKVEERAALQRAAAAGRALGAMLEVVL